MAQVDMSVSLNAPAESVWELIGGFDALPRWHPTVASSRPTTENAEMRRRLSLHGGGEILEALERHDDAAGSYSYTIIEGPLSVAGYRSQLSVEPAGAQGCTVRWTASFEPKGAPESDALAAVRRVYQEGFDSLRTRFGG
jgi:hypothetical protein